MKRWFTSTIILLLFLAFSSYALYQYKQQMVDTSAILSFWMALFTLGVLLVQMFSGEHKERKMNGMLFLISSFVCLMLLEGFLRFGLEHHKTLWESMGHQKAYKSMYWVESPHYYHVHSPNKEIDRLQPEFEWKRTTNSLGITEKELPFKVTDKKRILCMGDSFTEGIGTSYDSTWVRSTERYLQEKVDSSIQLINGGVGGSDAFFEASLAMDKLLVYEPDMVVFCINSTDIGEILFRGGEDRFRSDSTIQYAPPPWWEPIYAFSFTFRMLLHDVLGYDWTFNSPSNQPIAMRATFDKIYQLFDTLNIELKEQEIDLFLVIHPLIFEFRDKNYWPGYFPELLKVLPNTNSLDLFEAFQQDSSVMSMDLHELYWPIDHHFTPKGFWLMGEIIGQNLEKYLKTKQNDIPNEKVE